MKTPPTPLSARAARHATAGRPRQGLGLAGWAWGGLLAGALLTLLLCAPARWLADGLAHLSQQQLQLVDARGSIWNGSARLLLSGGADSLDASALPGRLRWTLAPGWGGLRLELAAECCTPEALQLRAQPQWDGLRLELADSQSAWPAQWLAGLGTPWNTLQPEGQLLLRSHALSAVWAAGRLQLAGSAQLEAHDVSSRLSTLRPMGSYRLLLQGGPSATLALETLEGSLQLSGQGEWVGQRLRFRGQASAAPEREAALANLLNIIGRRDGPRSLITLG